MFALLLSELRAPCRAASDVFRVLKCTTQWQVLRRLSSASQLSMLAQTGESHSSPRHGATASSTIWVADCHAAAERCMSHLTDTQSYAASCTDIAVAMAA